MSLHPIETAKSLYDFVGLAWTEETEKHIYNSTIGKYNSLHYTQFKKFRQKNGGVMVKTCNLIFLARALTA